MFTEPEYAQYIIIGVIFHDKFVWYVTTKEYWYLDYTKYDHAFLAFGYKKVENDLVSESIDGEVDLVSYGTAIAERR